jgi:F-type H+-transporting ATPase subunit beta
VAVLSRDLASQGLYPAVDPLTSSSNLLAPRFVGDHHYQVARRARETLARYAELADLIAILGIEELSDEERRVALRARRLQRFLTQPFFSTAKFSDMPGAHVSVEETVSGVEQILDGAYDDVPEQAFYMVATVDEALQKAETVGQRPSQEEKR